MNYIRKMSIFLVSLIIAFTLNDIKTNALNINTLKIQSITSNKQSPQLVSNAIHFTANANMSSGVLYQYSIYLGQTRTAVRYYNSDKTFLWTPTKAGTYRIKVEAKKVNSSKNVDTSKETSFVVINTPALKLQSITSNKQSPQLINNAIHLTANTNMSSGVLYQYSIYLGQTRTAVRYYNSDKTFLWTPTKAGTYRIKVEAKKVNSSNYADTSSETSFIVRDPAGISNINFSVPSPSVIGTPVVVAATGSSASTTLYRYSIYNGSNWTLLSDYSNNNKYTWTPAASGRYSIKVEVKDVLSNKSFDSFLQKDYVIMGVPEIQEVSTNVSSPRKIGNNIVVTTKAIYGITTLYRYSINDGNTWTVVRDYSTDANYTWTPNKEGNYKIKVDVKDKSSIKDFDNTKEIPYEILKYGGIIYTNTNLTLEGFLTSQMNLSSKPQTWNNGTWIDATKDQVQYYLNPDNFINDYGIYQFLKLTYTEGITAEDLNKVLVGKGVLEGKGATFLNAGKQYNINPVYLVAHSLLETGNGTSALARGILVTSIHETFGDLSSKLITLDKPVTTYNVYGYGAYDVNPDLWGSEKAYREGWFTVEQAIMGGAKFISQGYINSVTYNQNTLYKMRWDINSLYRNPSSPYAHQYATDVGWAYKQSLIMKNIISKMNNSMFYYEIPKFN